MKKLTKVFKPTDHSGFLGKGHTAREVIRGSFKESDPFILLMDDILNKQDGEPAGGPHPHAGFETVSLLLEGEIGDARHTMKAGDFQIMTAGSGIVHTETINTKKKLRMLQMWLNLPKTERWALPVVQDLSAERAPSKKTGAGRITVYSGQFAGMVSPVKNKVPLIVADIELKSGQTLSEKVPAHFKTFMYQLDGDITVGEDRTALKQGEVGWLNVSEEIAEDELKIAAGDKGARFILYSGEPTKDDIVSYGPFIADSEEQIRDLYRKYRDGELKHITTVAADQKFVY